MRLYRAIVEKDTGSPITPIDIIADNVESVIEQLRKLPRFNSDHKVKEIQLIMELGLENQVNNTGYTKMLWKKGIKDKRYFLR